MKDSVLEKAIKKEIKGSIERNDLIDWFLKKQDAGIKLNYNITIKDLITTAEEQGIEVTRERNKKVH